MHPPLEIVRADAVPPQDLHRAFGEAFSDYLIGPFNLAFAQWPLFLARQGVDLALSRVAIAGETPRAFAFVAPRAELGWWRLGTMGAVPAQRGSGAARHLLDDFIARAAQAGMRGVELECFAQNERALRLYRSHGFEAVHELRGYAREGGQAPAPVEGASFQETALEEAFAWLDEAASRHGDLPLQVTTAALRPQPLPFVAWRCRQAQLVFAQTAPEALTIASLIDLEPGQPGAFALAAALIRRHPAHRISLPQLQRADLGGEALERLGFARQPLHQLYMRRPF